jgi:26S proteasome non-ATPase regulatory subunit 9
MSRIEKGLHEHHARLAEQAQNNPGGANQAQGAFGAQPAALEAPFAKVNSIVAGSPAESAGLRVGDTITKFGWVDWTNHERLSRVTEAVSQNEGVCTERVCVGGLAFLLHDTLFKAPHT